MCGLSLTLFDSFVLSTADILEMKVCQFQKHRDEQTRCEFERVLSMNVRIVGYILASFALSTGDIVEMKVCQFQRDRDEQAQRKFEFGVSIFIL